MPNGDCTGPYGRRRGRRLFGEVLGGNCLGRNAEKGPRGGGGYRGRGGSRGVMRAPEFAGQGYSFGGWMGMGKGRGRKGRRGGRGGKW